MPFNSVYEVNDQLDPNRLEEYERCVCVCGSEVKCFNQPIDKDDDSKRWIPSIP